MKIIMGGFLIAFAGLILSAAETYAVFEADYHPRWRILDSGAGKFFGTQLELSKNSTGKSQALLRLPNLKKNQLYRISGEISSSADWRSYCESGAAKVWETFGMSKPQKGNGEWQAVTFTAKFKHMPSVPYLVIELMSGGVLSARNFTVSEAHDPEKEINERLKTAYAEIPLITGGYMDLWQFHGDGRGERSGTEILCLKTEKPGSARWKFPGLPFESGVPYMVRLQARCTTGETYRVYAENHTGGRWQNAGAVMRTGTGEWEDICFALNWNNLNSDSCIMLEMRGVGEAQFRGLAVARMQSEHILNATFEAGTKGWELRTRATVIDTLDDGKALELKSGKGDSAAQAVSLPVSVIPLQRYRLRYEVRAQDGKGDDTNSHFFRVYPINARQNVIGKTGEWQVCMSNLGKQVKSVEFQALPRQPFIVLVAEVRAPGSVVFDNLVLEALPEERAAAELRLDPPFNYRDGIFASNPAERITGELRVFDAGAETSSLTLKNGAGNTVWRQPYNAAGKHRFDFGAPPAGETFTLELAVYGAADKLLAKEERAIRFFAPHTNEVSFTADGVMLVNGKRFFHLGHWSTTQRGDLGAEMAFLREAGFNTLLLDGPEIVLDLAQKHGMKLIRSLPEKFDDSGPEAKEAHRKRLSEQILRESAHPALLAWFAPDEPFFRGVPLEPMLEVYEFVRQADPYHPVWMNEAPLGEGINLRSYAGSCDIYGVDIYPVPEGNSHSALPDKGLTAVGKYADFCREVVENRKPVWMILQSFAWAQVGKPHVPADQAIFPTYHQSRFMAYNALLHGAAGLQYHYLGYSKNIPDEFWRDLRRVTLELSYLGPVFTADTVKDSPVSCDREHVRFLHKRYRDKNYYLIANESPDPAEASFSGMEENSLHVLLEKDPVAIRDGKLALVLPGYGVKVLSAAEFAAPDKIFKPESYRPYSEPLPAGKAMARLQECQWIWRPGEFNTPRSSTFFRRIFDLKSVPEKAMLRLYADDRFDRLKVNGHLIPKRDNLNYADCEISGLLQTGKNEISLFAADGGIAPCGLLVRLDIRLPGGETLCIASDRQFQTSPDGKSDWLPAEEIARFGAMPWGAKNPLLYVLMKDTENE